MKQIARTAIMTVALLSVTTTALAIESSKYLNIPEVRQEKDQWCWAGTSLSILNYYRIYTSQCLFVSYVKTGTTSPQTCNNLGASYTEAQKGLNYFGVSSSTYSGALSFAQTKTELTYSRPVYVSIGWLDNSGAVVGGHAVVIDGYYEYTNIGYEEVEYMDPWEGVHKTREYDSFVYTSGDQTWRWGLKNIVKK